MMEICCREKLYAYDAYHLTRAFFPNEEVRQSICAEAEEAVEILLSSGERARVKEQGVSLGKRERKYRAGREMYHIYRAYTGRSLPWGILTGVRPTKLAMRKLEEGTDREEFLLWFQRELLVSGKKAALAWEIAGREREILSRLDKERGYSLYVGIPFCPSVCSYCSFSLGTLSDYGDMAKAYLDALIKELSCAADLAKGAGARLNTIYIGGGTPTVLPERQLDRLLGEIEDKFSVREALRRGDLLEYTVEAGRPDTITRQKLEILKRYEVGRISVNPQTMQQRTLDAIGRRHRAQDTVSGFHMARECGFSNINMDIIAGLSGETRADMADTLRQIKELSPDSLTVHSLAVKRASRLAGEGAPAKDFEKKAKETAAMLRLAGNAAEKMGLSPYYLYRQKNIAGNLENVGYAKACKEGIYNILMMEDKQTIVACGAGASTKALLKEPLRRGEGKEKTTLMRIENVKDVRAYIARIDEMMRRKGEWLWR